MANRGGEMLLPCRLLQTLGVLSSPFFEKGADLDLEAPATSILKREIVNRLRKCGRIDKAFDRFHEPGTDWNKVLEVEIIDPSTDQSFPLHDIQNGSVPGAFYFSNKWSRCLLEPTQLTKSCHPDWSVRPGAN
jgi:hypothetical protein